MKKKFMSVFVFVLIFGCIQINTYAAETMNVSPVNEATYHEDESPVNEATHHEDVSPVNETTHHEGESISPVFLGIPCMHLFFDGEYKVTYTYYTHAYDATTGKHTAAYCTKIEAIATYCSNCGHLKNATESSTGGCY